jgi:quinol-cytochrome oxidoreductase complex cytochrome b subunit
VSRYTVERTSDARQVPTRVALLRADTSARVHERHEEEVPTAPHLLLREIILVEVCLVVLAVASLAFDAPLEGIADPRHTPNPAKAPWYFLGLQELLHYFPPVVAGVLLPLLAVVALVVIPYFRVNVEVVGFYERPWRRPLAAMTAAVAAISAVLVAFHVWPVLVPTLAVYLLLALPALPACPRAWRRRLAAVPLADWIMIWFVAVTVVLTVIGVAFRGPGWGWSLPWREGTF